MSVVRRLEQLPASSYKAVFAVLEGRRGAKEKKRPWDVDSTVRKQMRATTRHGKRHEATRPGFVVSCLQLREERQIKQIYGSKG